MGLTLDVLLALKAFHVGAAAAVSPQRSTALSMLNCAIHQLSERSDSDSGLRLAFYLAARSELLRGSPESLADRAAVQKLSTQLGSSFFDWFMKVENATESITSDKWSGSTSPYAAGGGSNADPENPYISPIGRTIRAIRAVGIAEDDLSAKDRRFLEHATLREMLEKHDIRHTS